MHACPRRAFLLVALLASQGAAAKDAPPPRSWYTIDGNDTDLGEPPFDLAETTRAASAGDARAAALLGSLYRHGTNGVERDDAASFMWLERGAEAGSVDAAFNLGMAFSVGGEGVAADAHEAVKWYARAAEAGDVEAMARLGMLYETGEGDLAPDAVESFAWFHRAAVFGHAKAQAQVGLCLYKGAGVKANVRLAVEWSAKAAAQGVPFAMINLGHFARMGLHGGAADPRAAMRWYEKAAAAATHEEERAAVEEAIDNLVRAEEL